MVQKINVYNFAGKTDYVLAPISTLTEVLIGNFKGPDFEGEFSEKPKKSIAHLVSQLKEFCEEYFDSGLKEEVYNEKWFLIPSIACMFIHRGALINPSSSIYTLPDYKQLASLTTEFGPVHERQPEVMYSLMEFIEVCKNGRTTGKKYPYKTVNNFVQNLNALLNSLELGSIFSYSGIMLYAMCLTGEGAYLRMPQVNHMELGLTGVGHSTISTHQSTQSGGLSRSIDEGSEVQQMQINTDPLA